METLSRESPHFKRCMELLPLVLDKEATDEDAKYFHQYARNWPDIQDCYDKESAFRQAIKQKLGTLLAPDELVSSIRDQIKQAS